VKKIYLSYL